MISCAALISPRNGIAVYSPHTAMDSVNGGVNDWLLSGLNVENIEPLVPHAKVEGLIISFNAAFTS